LSDPILVPIGDGGAPPLAAAVPAEQHASTLQMPAEGLDLIFGPHDDNLRRIERAFGVAVTARGVEVRIQGGVAGVQTVEHLFGELSQLVAGGYRLRQADVQTAIRVLQDAPETRLAEFFADDGPLAIVRRMVQPRTLNQQLYMKAMLDHDMVVSIGPAGTGKTFLAVAVAVAALQEKQVRRIVLARPAVEAGEKLGFLPGDLAEKVNPYLRPLYDSLNDLLGFEKLAKLMERQIIEVAPLAFMRGRTLNDSFVILDEAQNTTSEQMKMFLTRIGNNSKAVINGDITQVDLPKGQTSGLREAEVVLAGVEGIKFVHFEQQDVVRHPLVARIVRAYAAFEASRAAGSLTPR
jgi:phosphate starvation-inducible PhoH-like protein